MQRRRPSTSGPGPRSVSKLALGPEEGKGFNESTYKRTVSQPTIPAAKSPSPRIERSDSFSVQDLLLRRHPLGPRNRDADKRDPDICFLQIFHDAENCFVGSTEILDLFDLRRRLFARLEDSCESLHYLDCMSMPYEWRFYMHGVDETGSAFKPSRQDMEQFLDLGITHIDPGSKTDAVDLKMQNDIQHFMEVHESVKSKFLVVIISGDRDFAPCLRRLDQKGFTTALVVNSNDARPVIRRIANVDCGDWESLKSECALNITSVLCTRQGRGKLWYACRHVIQDESADYQDMRSIIRDFADYHVAIINVLRADGDAGNGNASPRVSDPQHAGWMNELRSKALSVLTTKDIGIYDAAGGGGGGAADAASTPSSAKKQRNEIDSLIDALAPWTTITGVVTALVHGSAGQTKNLLMEAARRGREDIVAGLLTEDGMVEAVLNATTSSSKYTALHYAAYHGHAGVVDVLLKYGADASLVNAAGETAVESASRKGFDIICDKISEELRQQLGLVVDLNDSTLENVQQSIREHPGRSLDAAFANNSAAENEAAPRNPAVSAVELEVPRQDSGTTVDSDSSFRTPIPTPSHSRSRSSGDAGSGNADDDDDSAPTPRMRLGRHSSTPQDSTSYSGLSIPPQKRSLSVPRSGSGKVQSWRGQAQIDASPKHFTTQLSNPLPDSSTSKAAQPSPAHFIRPSNLSRSLSTPVGSSPRNAAPGDVRTNTPGSSYRRATSFVGDGYTPGPKTPGGSYGRAPFCVCSGYIERVRVEAWFVRIEEPVANILGTEDFKEALRRCGTPGPQTPGSLDCPPGLQTPSHKNPQDIFFHVSECKFDSDAISNLLRFTPDLAPRVVCHVTMDKRGRLKAVNVRLLGTVIMQKDKFGFIRHEAYPKNLYYKFSDVRSQGGAVNNGDLVSFEVTTHREKVWAINVRHFGVDHDFLRQEGTAAESTPSHTAATSGRPLTRSTRRHNTSSGDLSFSSSAPAAQGDAGGAELASESSNQGYDYHPFADGSYRSGGFTRKGSFNSGRRRKPPTGSSGPISGSSPANSNKSRYGQGFSSSSRPSPFYRR